MFTGTKEKDSITLENCALIHLVNVFFCTVSCSSVGQREHVSLENMSRHVKNLEMAAFQKC